MRRVVLLCLTLIVFSTVKAQLNNCDMEFVIDEYNPSSYQNGNNGIEKYYKIILYISRDHGWF